MDVLPEMFSLRRPQQEKARDDWEDQLHRQIGQLKVEEGKRKPYMKVDPKSTGVDESWVSFDWQAARAAGESAEKKSITSKKKTKKWWEFWK